MSSQDSLRHDGAINFILANKCTICTISPIPVFDTTSFKSEVQNLYHLTVRRHAEVLSAGSKDYALRSQIMTVLKYWSIRVLGFVPPC